MFEWDNFYLLPRESCCVPAVATKIIAAFLAQVQRERWNGIGKQFSFVNNFLSILLKSLHNKTLRTEIVFYIYSTVLIEFYSTRQAAHLSRIGK